MFLLKHSSSYHSGHNLFIAGEDIPSYIMLKTRYFHVVRETRYFHVMVETQYFHVVVETQYFHVTVETFFLCHNGDILFMS